MSGALQQFVGAKVLRIRMVDDEQFVIEFEMPPAPPGGFSHGDRILMVYNPYAEQICVCIDGGFVPKEEL